MSRFTSAHVVLLQKLGQALSGVITISLVAHFLTPGEQGYYYAIGSLLSAYVILDLGLAGLLVQISARMFAGLELERDGGVAPPGLKKSVYLAFVRWSIRWYAMTSVFALGLLPIGFFYFSFAGASSEAVHWQWPWVLTVSAAALSLAVYPALSAVEGTGRVAEVYWVRLMHYVLSAPLMWALLIGGSGLYAPAMLPLVVAVGTALWFRLRYPRLLCDDVDGHGFPWREVVWPLQKRVALTSLSNYISLNVPTLLVFYFVEAGSAGRLGLSMVLGNLLGSLCASWLVAKVPEITQLAAQGLHDESRNLFKRGFKKAAWLMSAGYVFLVLLVMSAHDVSIAHRLLAPSELAALFAVFIVFHSVSILSAYFRAHGREAMAIPMLLATSMSVIFALWAVQKYGVGGVVGSFLVCYCLICIPAMLWAWIGARTG